MSAQPDFDMTIGRLDRILSEFLLLHHDGFTVDEANRQTLKHHADDLIGVGNAMLERLGIKPQEVEIAEVTVDFERIVVEGLRSPGGRDAVVRIIDQKELNRR